MIELILAEETQHSEIIRQIFWEYLMWVNERVQEEYGLQFDMQAMIEDDMRHLDKFMPPKGSLVLGYVDSQLAGIVCLTELQPEVVEIRRMYVRPAFRRNGLGRSLLNTVIEEAAKSGRQRIRLDSARYMHDAHRLYHSMGFMEIEAYEGSEIPLDFQKHWVFMEKRLENCGIAN